MLSVANILMQIVFASSDICIEIVMIFWKNIKIFWENTKISSSISSSDICIAIVHVHTMLDGKY